MLSHPKNRMTAWMKFTSLVIVAYLVYAAEGAWLGQQCHSDSDCTELHAVCQPHECHGFICLCKEGYVINKKKTQCDKVSLIGEPCNQTTACLPRNSTCNSSTSMCECWANSRPTQDGFWCIKPGHKAVGEPCNTNDTCGLGAECSSGKCACAEWHVLWGHKERWLGLPVSKFSQCENTNHTLNSCNGTTFAPAVEYSAASASTRISPVSHSTAQAPTTLSSSTSAGGQTTTAALGALLGQECHNNTDCTDLHAVCLPHRCDGFICQCTVGYVINKEKTHCDKVSLIGEPCNQTTACLPRNSKCNSSTSMCECWANFRPTQDGFWCIKPGHKALGQPCNANDSCGLGAECRSGKCACAEWHAPWGHKERWIGLPVSKFGQCENTNFTLSDISLCLAG